MDIELATFPQDHPGETIERRLFDTEEVEVVVPETLDEGETPHSAVTVPPPTAVRVAELPPVDKGPRAWTFCACACVVEILIFGWNRAYGVFQDYYTSHPPFQHQSAAVIAMPGTVGLGIQYLEAVLVVAACQRYPEHAKSAMWLSLLVSVTALAISSFATQMWHLILLQGVVFGLSAGVCYGTVIAWIPQWFVARRGLAGGLIFGGSGLGGLLVPLLVGGLLDKVGFRWTIRIYTLLLAVGLAIALLGVNPRVPARRLPEAVGRPRRSWLPNDIAFLRSPRLLLTLAAFATQALAYFPVSIFIPSYTSSLSSSSISSTVSLSLFNASSLLGYLSVGRLTDAYAYPVVVLTIGFASALLALLLWGFADHLAEVFLFAAIFGGLNGGFSASWPAAATDLAGEWHEQTSIAIGLFSGVKGVAAVAGPIVAASFYSAGSSTSSSPSGTGSNSTGIHVPSPSTYGAFGFRNVQLFVGAMALTTGILGLVLIALPAVSRWRGISHRS